MDTPLTKIRSEEQLAMLKNAALLCALMGFALSAYAGNTPPPKVKPPVNQGSPNKAALTSLNSFKMGSPNAGSGSTGNTAGGSAAGKTPSGTIAGKTAGTNIRGTGGGSGNLVGKSAAGNLNKGGTYVRPPTTAQHDTQFSDNPKLNFRAIAVENVQRSPTASDDVASGTPTNPQSASSLAKDASTKPQIKAPLRRPQ
jgi:hypothetical protein